MSDNKIVSSTKQSKIVRYKLEELCVNLKRSGLSYNQIADELNSSGKVPSDDKIDKFVVARFLDKLPELTKQVVQEDKKRLMQVVNSNMDIIHEIGTLFHKTKMLMTIMEENSMKMNGNIDPYRYKALCSEMRELLKQMTDIQKDVNDYNNIRKFLEIVIQILMEEAPNQLPKIVEKLKTTKGTQWFADIIDRKV
jgi:hypothetical protein